MARPRGSLPWCHPSAALQPASCCAAPLPQWEEWDVRRSLFDNFVSPSMEVRPGGAGHAQHSQTSARQPLRRSGIWGLGEV